MLKSIYEDIENVQLKCIQTIQVQVHDSDMVIKLYLYH